MEHGGARRALRAQGDDPQYTFITSIGHGRAWVGAVPIHRNVSSLPLWVTTVSARGIDEGPSRSSDFDPLPPLSWEEVLQATTSVPEDRLACSRIQPKALPREIANLVESMESAISAFGGDSAGISRNVDIRIRQVSPGQFVVDHLCAFVDHDGDRNIAGGWDAAQPLMRWARDMCPDADTGPADIHVSKRALGASRLNIPLADPVGVLSFIFAHNFCI
jgi:hypothetical protein